MGWRMVRPLTASCSKWEAAAAEVCTGPVLSRLPHSSTCQEPAPSPTARQQLTKVSSTLAVWPAGVSAVLGWFCGLACSSTYAAAPLQQYLCKQARQAGRGVGLTPTNSVHTWQYVIVLRGSIGCSCTYRSPAWFMHHWLWCMLCKVVHGTHTPTCIQHTTGPTMPFSKKCAQQVLVAHSGMLC